MAYFALFELHRLPHEIFSLPEEELAVIYAFFDVYVRKQAKDAAKLNKRR